MATYPFQLQPSPSMRESGAQKGAWWQNVCFVFDLKRSSLAGVVRQMRLIVCWWVQPNIAILIDIAWLNIKFVFRIENSYNLHLIEDKWALGVLTWYRPWCHWEVWCHFLPFGSEQLRGLAAWEFVLACSRICSSCSSSNNGLVIGCARRQ